MFIIFWLFLFLVLFEIGLHLDGFMLLSLPQDKDVVVAKQKDTYRILCLGESPTALRGKDSYPSQLEEVLNERNIGIKFRVINKGIVGTNTSAIVSLLEDNLNQYYPDMVITLMGINDLGASVPYKDIALYKPKETKRYTKLSPRLSIRGLKENYPAQRDSHQAEESLKKAIELNPKNAEAYVGLGRIYIDQGGKYSQAEEFFQKAIELNHVKDRLYAALAVVYKEMGKDVLDEEYYKKANDLRWEYYNPITYYNYQRLKETLDQKGIKLVCVQYPVRSIEQLKKMFSNQEGIIFVDNERVFKEALKDASYREYFRDIYGGEFGNCIPKGNRLLAENIATVILKEYFNQ